jgi:hypothetical protein
MRQHVLWQCRGLRDRMSDQEHDADTGMRGLQRRSDQLCDDALCRGLYGGLHERELQAVPRNALRRGLSRLRRAVSAAFSACHVEQDYAKTTLVDLSSGDPMPGASFQGFALDVARVR